MFTLNMWCARSLKAISLFLVLGLFCLTPSSYALSGQGGLHVVGNHVYTSNGQVYIPEGISVYGGLEARNYRKNVANDYAQIEAAALYWHANTVRLQVAEKDLFSHVQKGQPYNKAFLAALKQQVSYAQGFGMAVVINDQTEFTNNTPNPTQETIHFWQVIADQFKNQPYVIFDLFNEPRLTSAVSTNTLGYDQTYNSFIETNLFSHRNGLDTLSRAQVWRIWQEGGIVDGKKYIGMQELVNVIRNARVSNIVWVEGPYEARKLPTSKYLLRGTNIVYAIHHPNLNSPKSWQTIGRLSVTQPVVEGEWAQYESKWAECYDKAYSNAPKYLNFLQTHQIGVIAWSLQADALLAPGKHSGQPTNLNRVGEPVSAVALQTPSRLQPNYACDAQYGEGAGQLMKNYFAKNSNFYTF